MCIPEDIEYALVECENHDPDGCECDNGMMVVVIDHGDDDQLYEPDWEDLWEQRYGYWRDVG